MPKQTPTELPRSSFTIDEIGARNDVGRNLIYSEIASGHLKSTKIGKARRITPQQEADWLKSREVKA